MASQTNGPMAAETPSSAAIVAEDLEDGPYTVTGEDIPLLKDERERGSMLETVPSHPQGLQFFCIASSVSLLVFVSGLEITITAAIGAVIASDLQQEALAPYLGTAFLLAAAVSAPIYAGASDLCGRSTIVLVSGLMFSVGMLFCAMAPNMPLLLMARAWTGMGAGGISIISSIILSESVPLRSRALWYSIGKIIAGVSTGLGGPVGGILADRMSWRMAFAVQVPVCFLSVLVAYVCLRSSTTPTVRKETSSRLQDIDITGSVLLITTIVPILAVAAILPSALRNLTPLIIISLTLATIISCISGVVFYHVEKTVKNPIINVSLLHDSSVVSLCFLNFIAAGAYHAVLYLLPFFVIMVDHQSASAAGMHLVPVALVASLGSLVVGASIARSGKYNRFLVAGRLFIVLGLGLLVATTIAPKHSRARNTLEFLGVLPIATGNQIISSVSMVAIMTIRDSKDLAACTGLASVFKSLGGVFGSAISAFAIDLFRTVLPICQATSSNGSLSPALSDDAMCWNQTLFGVFVGFSIFSAVALACTPAIRGKPISQSESPTTTTTA